jgi:hypothetical protein
MRRCAGCGKPPRTRTSLRHRIDPRHEARCERASRRTLNESGPGGRGELPGLGRWQAPVGGVWPDLVVVEAPPLEQAAGVAEVLEDFLVQSSSRSRPMKLSTKAFCCGLPGAI